MQGDHDERTYWGELEHYSEEYASAVCERFSGFQQALSESGVADRLIRSWCMYHARDREGHYDTQEITYHGDKGEVVRASINEYRSLLRTKLSLATGMPLVFQALALNNDATSLSASLKAQNILKHYEARGGLRAARRDAAEQSLVMAASFVSALWDTTIGEQVADFENEEIYYSGDVRFRVHNLFEVAYDTSSEDVRDPRWTILRIKVNKHELAKQLPKHADKIYECAKANSSPYNPDVSRIFTRDDPDYIWVYAVFFRPCMLLPVGRMSVVLDNKTVIYDGASSYSRVPVFMLAPSMVIGESKIPYGDEHDLLLPVELLQHSFSTLASGHDATVAALWTPEGVTLEHEKIANFSHLQGGMTAPQTLHLYTPNQHAYQWIGILRDTAQRITQVNDAMLGDPNASSSGTKTAFQVSTGMNQQKGFTGELTAVMEQVATMAIEILRTNVQTDRVIAIVGRQNMSEAVRFKSSDLKLVQSVTVQSTSPELDSPQGRQKMVEMAAQYGWVNSVDEYITAYMTGSLGIATQDNTDHYILIRRENEQLREANAPMPVVDETDEHQAHIDQHRLCMNDDEVRRDPALKKRHHDHILEHVLHLTPGSPQFFPQILSATGQKPLPNVDPGSGAPKVPLDKQPPGARDMPQPNTGSAPKRPGVSGTTGGAGVAGRPPSMPSAPKTAGSGSPAPTPALDGAPVPPGARR